MEESFAKCKCGSHSWKWRIEDGKVSLYCTECNYNLNLSIGGALLQTLNELSEPSTNHKTLRFKAYDKVHEKWIYSEGMSLERFFGVAEFGNMEVIQL